MPIHPNLLKGPMSPKEKAALLAEQSMGVSIETDKNGRPLPYYMVPISVSNRHLMITTVETIINAKELPKEDKTWWKEVLTELKKLPNT
jgi:hypothetical protein